MLIVINYKRQLLSKPDMTQALTQTTSYTEQIYVIWMEMFVKIFMIGVSKVF